MYALLLAGADTQLIKITVHGGTAPRSEVQGQPTTTGLRVQGSELIRAYTRLIRQQDQQAAPPQLVTASPSDAGEPAVISPTCGEPAVILLAAKRGEVQTVVSWLRKEGPVDALCSVSTGGGQTTAVGLLHVAATHGQLEMVRELLKQGASVDLQNSFGTTALMSAAYQGHLSIVLLLLQHSANPDLQSNEGGTALMMTAYQGHEACVQALLRAEANTELRDGNSHSALQWAESQGHTATAKLIRQHASCLSLGLGLALCCTVVPLAWPWVVLSVVLGAMATVAFSRALLGVGGRHRAARQRRPHRPSRRAKAHGRTNTAETTQQHAAPSQVPRADAAMERLLAEEAAAQAKEQAPSKMSKKKKKKADRAAAAGDEPSGAPPASAPALPLAAAPEPAVLAAEQAEAALPRAAIAGGWLSTLEAALAAAPREVREGGVGVEARALCHRLLEAQQEAERKAKRETAAEAARLEAAEQPQEVAVREAERVAAASKARGMAVAAAAALVAATEAAAAAEAEADALERATADGGEGGSSGAAGPSEASEVAVPDQYVCSITAEIMTDPVCTVRAIHCPRGLFCIPCTRNSRPHHPTPRPSSAVCPPHIAKQVDGHTYERSAIELWLETHNTSPATGAELESKQLNPNHSLRSLIQDDQEAGTKRHKRDTHSPARLRSPGRCRGVAGAAGGRGMLIAVGRSVWKEHGHV